MDQIDHGDSRSAIVHYLLPRVLDQSLNISSHLKVESGTVLPLCFVV